MGFLRCQLGRLRLWFHQGTGSMASTPSYPDHSRCRPSLVSPTLSIGYGISRPLANQVSAECSPCHTPHDGSLRSAETRRPRLPSSDCTEVELPTPRLSRPNSTRCSCKSNGRERTCPPTSWISSTLDPTCTEPSVVSLSRPCANGLVSTSVLTSVLPSMVCFAFGLHLESFADQCSFSWFRRSDYSHDQRSFRSMGCRHNIHFHQYVAGTYRLAFEPPLTLLQLSSLTGLVEGSLSSSVLSSWPHVSLGNPLSVNNSARRVTRTLVLVLPVSLLSSASLGLSDGLSVPSLGSTSPKSSP